MANTENFGFKILGPGDSLDEDGYQFVNGDRVRMDTILNALMEHSHTGSGSSSESADDAPQLSLGSSGNISAGRRLYYRYTLVDENGNESAASPTAHVDTPDAVSSPAASALSVATTGGTLLPGTYYYGVTAYTSASSLETKMNATAYVTVAAGSSANVITLTLPSLPSGATGFNIYRKGPGNPRYYFLASTTSATYADDGSVALTTSRTTPSRNTTNNGNSVEIGYPTATPTVPTGYTWKIYRTYDQADWSNSLLKWVVEETSEGSGIIDPYYDDVGGSTQTGSPPSAAYAVSSPTKIDMEDAAEIQGSPPPGLLTVPHQIQFGQSGTVVQGEGLVPWVCEFDNAEVVEVRATLGRDSTASNDITFDVVKYDANIATPVWASIFDPGDRPVISQGDWRMEDPVEPTSETRLLKGDALIVDVDSSNEELATPTAVGYIVTILLMVNSGSETVSWDWS